MTLPTTTLLHGDCLNVMPTLPANSVSMFLCDLPYNVTLNRWDVSLDIDALWLHIKRLRTGGARTVLTAKMRFAARMLQSNDKEFRHDLVWSKPRGSNFAAAKVAPMCSHEHILVFSKGKGKYNPQKTTGHKIVKVTNGKHAKGSTNDGIVPIDSTTDTTRYPLTVQSFARDDMRNKNGHPTQKPVSLLEWLIRTYTNEGDTVLDPTAGSGTTAVAALRTGRHSICIEKDQGYYDMMCKRVADERARLTQTD